MFRFGRAVREAFAVNPDVWKHERGPQTIHYLADAKSDHRTNYTKKSPLYMPRWASRITLEVTNVEIQRIQDISEDDAMAEGIEKKDGSTCRDDFEQLWSRIHGANAWNANPWVAAISFKTHHCNLDSLTV